MVSQQLGLDRLLALRRERVEQLSARGIDELAKVGKKNATTFHFADDGDGGYCHHVDVLACRSTPCFVVFRRAGCFISLFRDLWRHV